MSAEMSATTNVVDADARASQVLDLATATRIVDAAFAAATARSLARIAVVVTDVGGDVRAAMRSDGQGAFGIDIAQTKARSAIGFRRSTLLLAVHFGQHVSSTIGVTAATGQRFIPIGGGVAVVDRHGVLIGAVAVAGGMPDVDDAIAREALRSVGLEALP